MFWGVLLLIFPYVASAGAPCKQTLSQLQSSKFEVMEVEPSVFFLGFNDRREMAETLVRFQESYESPKFKGKTFLRSEYKAWYRTVSESGKYTYHKDWSGFNFPNWVLEPFYQGHFIKLTKRERAILNYFRNIRGKFYVIGALSGDVTTIPHEVSHGRFYLNDAYREEILRTLTLYPNEVALIEKRLEFEGYHSGVFKDEVQAYVLNDSVWMVKNYELDPVAIQPLYSALKEVEKRFYP